MQTTNDIAIAQYTSADTVERTVEHAWLKAIGLDRWNMEYSSSVAIDFEYSSMAHYMLPRIGQ